MSGRTCTSYCTSYLPSGRTCISAGRTSTLRKVQPHVRTQDGLRLISIVRILGGLQLLWILPQVKDGPGMEMLTLRQRNTQGEGIILVTYCKFINGIDSDCLHGIIIWHGLESIYFLTSDNNFEGFPILRQHC